MNDKFEKLTYKIKAIDVFFVIVLAQMFRVSWEYFFIFLVGGGLQYARMYLYEMQVKIVLKDVEKVINEVHEEINTK